MATKAFSEAQWKKYAGTVAGAYGMDAAGSKALQANTAAKLVCALPFLAGCHEPERTALAHLSTFVLASSDRARAAFDHKKEDDRDPLARLAVISHFEGGDPALVQRGMKLLALILINGYRRDVKADAQAGEYNPIGSKAWNPDQKIAALQADIAAVPSPAMDAIVGPGAAVQTFWQT